MKTNLKFITISGVIVLGFLLAFPNSSSSPNLLGSDTARLHKDFNLWIKQFGKKYQHKQVLISLFSNYFIDFRILLTIIDIFKNITTSLGKANLHSNWELIILLISLISSLGPSIQIPNLMLLISALGLLKFQNNLHMMKIGLQEQSLQSRNKDPVLRFGHLQQQEPLKDFIP